MTDPYESPPPRTSPELGGTPETGARIDPASYPPGGAAGSETSPAAGPPGAVPAAGAPPSGTVPAAGAPASDTAPAAGAPASGTAPAADRGVPAPGFDQRGHVRGGRISGVWIGSIATALFVILLIIFIAQNSRQVSIHFLGWHGEFSLGLAILLAAVVGVLLVAIPGSLRIVQLRRALRKNVPSGRTR
ncbi:MAG: hypothetical protein QOI26_1284 [Pseudonocardiales bacterium]|nr:hypothetical protein [Pseudonocardiales bacterium]